MAQSLISPSEVFIRTWHEGKKYLSNDMATSVGILGLALISFAIAIISFYAPEGVRFALRAVDIFLFQIIGTSWVSLRLETGVLSERTGKKLKLPTPVMVVSYLLIAILNGLAAAGGLLVFVIPGIWLTVLFFFAKYAFIDEGKTHFQALARSAELVRGRWWATIGRLILPGLMILIISMTASSIIEALVGFIAGYHPSSLVSQVNLLNWTVFGPPPTQIAVTALQVIDALSMIIALPFFTHLMVTVYLELKRTQ